MCLRDRIISRGRHASSQFVTKCVWSSVAHLHSRCFSQHTFSWYKQGGINVGFWIVLTASKGHDSSSILISLLSWKRDGWASKLGDAGSHSSLYHLLVGGGLTGSQVLSSGLIQWTASSLPTSPKMHPTAAWLYYPQKDFISIISSQLQTPFSEN